MENKNLCRIGILGLIVCKGPKERKFNTEERLDVEDPLINSSKNILELCLETAPKFQLGFYMCITSHLSKIRLTAYFGLIYIL
jgi:hypothetical protein